MMSMTFLKKYTTTSKNFLIFKKNIRKMCLTEWGLWGIILAWNNFLTGKSV